MSTASVDLKLTLSTTGATRALSLPAAPAPTWSSFANLIKERFNLATIPAAVCYLDADNDEITLSSDVELEELWAQLDGGDSFEDPHFTVVVVSEDQSTTDIDPEKAAARTALLDSIKEALKSDLSLAGDIHHVLRESVGHRHPRHFGRHHHGQHPGFGFVTGRGRGGWGGFRGGVRGAAHRPSHWGMREEETTSGSDTEEQVTDNEKEQQEFGQSSTHKHKHAKHAHKSHHHHRGPPPPSAPFPFPFAFSPGMHPHSFHPFGPPPPPPRHHGKRGPHHFSGPLGPLTPPFPFDYMSEESAPQPHHRHHHHHFGPPPPFPPPSHAAFEEDFAGFEQSGRREHKHCRGGGRHGGGRDSFVRQFDGLFV